ncbi:MAG TPA: pyridoxal phosphate-dependent aminotransferase [Candidatus Cloacimonadota bacterium]|nr:pyridoxal phosphate-dependent aminotransferase [Candidatus Cloacimonadota bacterium]
MISKRLANIQKSIIRQIFDNASPDAINLGLGEIQFETPNVIRLKAKQVINQGEIFYTPNAGLLELRQKVAEYYDRGSQIPTHFYHVCICNGAQEAIFAILFSLIDPGDELLIADPTFISYQTIAEMLGAKVKTFPLSATNGFAFDINYFRASISKNTKAVFLNHPSNPSGKAFSKEDIEDIITTCKEHNTLLIVDEVYKDLYLHEQIPSFWGKYENTIIISGLSKSFCMTGWRLGWIVAKEDLLQKFIIAHQYITTCASTISQKSAIEAFTPKGISSLIQLRKRLRKNYKIATEYLKLHLNYQPDSAPYIMIKVKEDDIKFCKGLAHRGVIVIPGSAFGEQSKGYIRINYALNERKLRMGLNILVAALN